MLKKILRPTFYVLLISQIILLVLLIYRQQVVTYGIPLAQYKDWLYVLSGIWIFLLGIALTSVLGKGVLRKKEAFLSLALVFVLPVLYHLVLAGTVIRGGIET